MVWTCMNNILLYLATKPWWFLLVCCLGFFIILSSCISLVRWIYSTFLRPAKNLKICYGSWALITGATDGIGKAFAHQLAQKGLNLVLVGRNSDKLKRVCNEIHAKFPEMEIKTVVLDFSRDNYINNNGVSGAGGRGVRQIIAEAIQGIEVGMVINNVGITYPGARYFDEVEEKLWMDVVRVNLEGTTWVTTAVLPGMLKRKRGAIVNIGSAASIVVPSHPLYTVYAATKAYIDQFSRCLNVEYKNHGIDVQCQVPLYVATKMTRRVALIEKTTLFIPSAEEYVRAAMGRIGYEARCTPYWAHSLQWAFSSFLPHSLLDAWRLSIAIRRRNNFNY